MKKFFPYKWALFIFVLATVLRILFLDYLPQRVDGDSSRFGLDGLKAWSEHWPFLGTGWYGHTNALMYVIGFFTKSFENELFGLRLFSALGGVLGVVATYFLSKKMFGERVALWSSLFLAICPFHIVLSRIGTEVVWMSFFAPISLFLILKTSWKHDLLAGVLIGVSQYLYPGARILPIMSCIFLGVLWLYKKKTLVETAKTGLIITAGLFLVYFPMARYFYFHQNEYFARIDMVGIVQSGWLENEMRNKSFLQVIIPKIIDNLKVFCLPVKTGAQFWFFRTPYLDALPAVFFIIGLSVSFIFIRKNFGFLFLVLFFLITVLFAGVLTVDSPTPSRYMIVFPVIAIFVGLGLEKTANILNGKRTAFLLFLLLVTSFVSYWKHEKVDTWRYDKNTQTATFTGRYLSKIKADYRVYFLSETSMYYDASPTLRFLTKRNGVNIFGSIEKEKGKINFKENYVFLILPSRVNELSLLKKINPGGFEKIIYNPRREILAYLFSNINLY